MKKMVVSLILLSLMISVRAYSNSGSEYWPSWRGPDSTGAAKNANPRWRGPDSTGAAKNANPPIKWSETENIKWKVKVPGYGLSSPVIWADKIFFLTAIESEKEGAYKFDFVCMDRNTGKILWQKTAREEVPHEGHHDTGSLASNSAVTDGKYVWASFGSRGVHCYDVDGNHKWSKDLGKMNIAMRFGEGSSAALAGEALIVVKDHEGDSAIYALNKETGDILWEKSRDEATSWASPLPVEVNGKLQVVTNATNFTRSYDVVSGEVIWQCSGQTRNVIPTPVSGFGKVYCLSGFRGSALKAIELGRTGDLSGSDAISWEVDRDTPYVPSPLLYDGKIYFLSVNNPVLSCYEAETGKPNFIAQRLEGVEGFYASPVGAAGRIYLASQNGVTLVISDADTYQVLATNKLEDRFDASPAIVGDEIFLKGKQYFYCIKQQ
ncbi:MAG: PQQ-binding-like beta-propeller repeat protein [Sedimentisphaerales bacterium]|nr:PQQ-binding-like beta-propeller repeat protein [Sedimentisphaerales bacterium]